MRNNLYLDFHVLQTVPPSCVNRDDTGSPKTATFGGATRARVSSQAWKHAMREMFRDILPEDMLGIRTKNVKQLLAERLMELNTDYSVEQADKQADLVLQAAQIKSGGDKKDVLFFISRKQIDALARTSIELEQETGIKEKEKAMRYQKALLDDPSIDICLFGRMAASDPTLNYDAAAQVAHSISTHAVSTEYDYFTAVDDYSAEDNSGAGHLGTVEFNSATLYRYATLNVCELNHHLTKEEVRTAVRGFAEAFIKSMPTGKQNTFANRTLPDMVYVTVRNDQPVNLVNAFEKPVSIGTEGYAQRSQTCFADYTNELYSKWAAAPEMSWQLCSEDLKLGEMVTYPGLLEALDRIIDSKL